VVTNTNAGGPVTPDQQGDISVYWTGSIVFPVTMTVDQNGYSEAPGGTQCPQDTACGAWWDACHGESTTFYSGNPLVWNNIAFLSCFALYTYEGSSFKEQVTLTDARGIVSDPFCFTFQCAQICVHEFSQQCCCYPFADTHPKAPGCFDNTSSPCP